MTSNCGGYCRLTIFLITASTLALAPYVGIAIAQTQQSQSSQRSLYDSRGHFEGNAINNGNGTESFYDGRGHFSGSAIRNSDGTTSLYDGRGHYSGSISRGRR